MEYLGFGLGLRNIHFERILSAPVKARWFEALTENYLGMEGFPHSPALKTLLKIRADYPITLHGVSMSIGDSSPLNKKYLSRLKCLQEQLSPMWISDHLCWTAMEEENLHDLLPIPFTEELFAHVSSRIDEVQTILGRPLVLENVSAYLQYEQSTMTESEFLARLVKKTGCRLLLDINNIYVNSINHNIDASLCLQSFPKEAIQQIHLAGHSRRGSYLIDTHSAPVSEEVWSLYRESVKIFGRISTMVEWDDKIPSYEVLEAEMLRAEREMHAVAD